MTALPITTYEASETLALKLAKFGAKFLAKRTGASLRAAENWKAGENGPVWKHTVAMLNDDQLCSRLLEAAGRADLASAQETIVALKAALIADGRR